jgi:hypothetical protein
MCDKVEDLSGVGTWRSMYQIAKASKEETLGVGARRLGNKQGKSNGRLHSKMDDQ